MQNQLSKYSIEELEKLVKEKEIVDVSLKHDIEINYFLSNFNITPGNKKIAIEQIYKLYKHWTKEPMTFKMFQPLLFDQFEHTKNKIHINLNQLKLTEALLSLIKENTKVPTDKHTILHFKRFFEQYSINSGEYKTSFKDICLLYDNWVMYTRRTVHGRELLKSVLDVYFDKLTTKEKVYYYTNDLSSLITQEKLLQKLKHEKEKTTT